MAIGAREWSRPAAAPLSFLRALGFYGLELLVVLVFFGLYYLLRGAAAEDIPKATTNALTIIAWEKSLGVFWEQTWQEAALPHGWLIDIANVTYMHLHLNLLLVMGLFLFRTDTRKYRVIRNALILSAFVGVPFYHLVPVTPPRLMEASGYDFGFVDTLITERRPRPGPLANWYAAIPSYHFGWILLLVFGTWWCWRSVLLRAGFIAFAGLMWWSIVVTGNHYFFDMVLGAIIVAGTFGLALAFERWADRNPERVAKFTWRVGPVRIPF